LALDVVLKATPYRMWAAHKKGMKDWEQCSRLMKIGFGPEEAISAQKYIGEGDPMIHVYRCRALWHSEPETKWTHRFIHMLDTIPKNWYLELEMRMETKEWEGFFHRFEITFTFEHEAPLHTCNAIGHPDKDFLKVELMEEVPLGSAHKANMMV
jgi:hypothetical protein